MIVPTCQRNALLAKCLTCIQASQPNELLDEIEVIVSDDGVTTTARELIEKTFPSVHWWQGPRRGPAANRNAGARQAKGRWLVFTDDDCLPQAGWLKAIADCARTDNFDIVEGKTIAPNRQDNPGKYYVENLSGGSFWSCNLAIKKDVFERLGGFDEDFLEAGGEDMELAFRIQTNKLRSFFSQEALVVHPDRDVTLQSLIWRTFLIRWTLLYQLKIGEGLPLTAPAALVIASLIWRSCLNLLRSTWHIFSKHDPRRWRTQLFDLARQWLTFPFVLPYLIVWELRFRKQLRNRII